jgi:hypothetical protein
VNALNPYEPKAHISEQNSPGVSLLVLGSLVLAVVAATAIGGFAGLQLVLMIAVLFVAMLPLGIVAMLRHRPWTMYVGHTIVAAGILLAAHLVLTATTVELLLRQPFVLDLVPYDGAVSFTMNIALPGSLLGLLIAALAPSQSPKRMVWIGGLLLTFGNVAAIGYGHYFFGTLLGARLAAHVWWM